MVIEEVRTILYPLKVFLIPSVVLPLGAIENLWKMPPARENAYNLVDCPSKVTKLKT